MQSQLAISFLVLVVVAITTLIFAIRYWITKSGIKIMNVSPAEILSSILLAMQIQVYFFLVFIFY
jgi:hypothetical protein